MSSVADPGIPDPDPTIAPSRIRIRIPDPGGKKAPDPGSDLFFTNFVYLSRIRIRPLLHPGSRIRIRNTAHELKFIKSFNSMLIEFRYRCLMESNAIADKQDFQKSRT
jgi:hypothetical protein